jgi:hypothetical protein
MAKNHKKLPVDQVTLAALSLSRAIAETIHESDKAFLKRLIPRVEQSQRAAAADGLAHVVKTLGMFLTALRNPNNFPP